MSNGAAAAAAALRRHMAEHESGSGTANPPVPPPRSDPRTARGADTGRGAATNGRPSWGRVERAAQGAAFTDGEPIAAEPDDYGDDGADDQQEGTGSWGDGEEAIDHADRRVDSHVVGGTDTYEEELIDSEGRPTADGPSLQDETLNADVSTKANATGDGPAGRRDDDPRRQQRDRNPRSGAGENAASKADQRTEKAVSAAMTAAGVPAPVSGKLAKSKAAQMIAKRWKKTALAPVVLGLLIFMAIFSGSFSGGDGTSGVYEVGTSEDDFSLVGTIPDPYLEAYRQAGRSAGVPWTILAAIGQRASDHGRVNPYEQNVPGPGGGSPSLAPGDVTRIFHIGDSLGYGMRNMGGAVAAFSQRGVTYNSRLEPGKRIAWATEEIAKPEYDDEIAGADILVNLGTNDWTRPIATFERDIDAFMSALPSGQRVWWYTLHRTGSEEYNAALRSAATRWPNLRVIDWAAHALTNGITPLESDPLRLHYGKTGYTAMVTFAVEQLLGNAPTTETPASGREPAVVTEDLSSCPTLDPPIAGETANQGFGPLMLKPSVLDASGFPIGDRVQNICESADALAAIMADTAAGLAEEKGLSWPRGVALLAVKAGDGDGAATQEVLAFWREVVDRLAVLGTVNRAQCDFGATSSLPEETRVGSMIYSYWNCELNNHPLESVETVSVADGMVTQQLLDLPQAVNRSVQEALSIAWTWSSWGAQPCDDGAEVAGVFPLRETDFERAVPSRFASRDRCNAEANIAAAAALFTAGESVPAATRPGLWNSTIGGWAEFPWVQGRLFGQVEGATPFDTEGPWTPLQVSAACARVLVNEVVKTAGETTAFGDRTAVVVQSYISDGLPEDLAPLADADLYTMLDRGRGHPSCATGRTRLPAEWFAGLSSAFNGDALSNPETGQSGTNRLPDVTTGDLTVPAGVGDKAAALARRASDLGEVALPRAEVGTTPLLQRLAHTRILVETYPFLPRVVVGEGLSRGAEIINIASTSYGGVFVGQRTAGTGAGFGLIGGVVPYAEAFNVVGQETGVDPRMLAAIAFQESNFNITSRCDQLDLQARQGYGMMQKDLGPDRRDERERICADVETDPDAAARYQVRQAADLFKAFLDSVGGDVEGALLAYNSGTYLGRYWSEVKPDLEALRTEARRYWCESNPNGWRDLARDGLRGCEVRGDVTVKYISPEPGTRSAINKYREYVQMFPGMVLTGSQSGVSGDTCPETATSMIPGKSILRGGSASIGLKQLCMDSVAQAATPEAARAIIYVFNNLGAIYDQPRRSQPGYYDCSSYVTRAYESAGVKMSQSNGWLFTTHYLMSWDGKPRPEWITEVSAFDARPGDLAFPKFGHVEMLLAHGYYAHAPASGDVTHIHKGPMLQFNRVNPALAPRIEPAA